MQLRKLRWLAIAGLVLVGACGSSGNKTSSSKTSNTTVKSNPDGVLRVASTIGDRTYDPIKPPTCAGEFWTLQLVYARLIDLTPDFKLQPMLADSWKFSADGSSLTLNLKKGVTFHDGSPFNAAAVKANLDRVKTDDKSTQKNELASMTSVDVVDPSTVKINLKPGTGYEIPMKLSGCAGMIVNPASLTKPDLDQTGDGLGAYVVKPGTFKAGQSATLVRAPGQWWGDPSVGPHFSEVDTTPIQDPTARLNALQSGQADVVDITPDQFARAQTMSSSGFQFKKFESHLNVSLSLNLNTPALQNTAVRQAINAAIDRQGISSAVFSGGCTPTVQAAAPGDLGYDKALDAQPAYNVDKAKQLLSQANATNLSLQGLQHTTVPY
ncbi:MAG: putative oligopeptide/dipeptide transporter substrate binding lipoprotein, partial [Acidimicrobiales bacterium]|nr:putative oligopeptide/dipeptide transporter substrate binding lipoprotein [Acidimicrobiales bacterium]